MNTDIEPKVGDQVSYYGHTGKLTQIQDDGTGIVTQEDGRKIGVHMQGVKLLQRMERISEALEEDDSEDEEE